MLDEGSMKVETAIEYVKGLLEKAGQVNQIIIHRQPGTLGDVTIEVRRQYRNESDLIDKTESENTKVTERRE